MSVKSSFFILAMLSFLVMIGVELVNWKYDRKAVENRAQEYAKDAAESFEYLLALKADPFAKQALDYATWNDLANYTRTKDEQWAKDNLDGSTVQFGINGFYILDTNNAILFSETDKPFLENLSSLVDISLLKLNNPALLHFFVKAEQGTIEFFIAPIHRIDTQVNDTSLAEGYVVIAKLWDDAFMQELNRYGIAEVSLRLKPLDRYKIAHEVSLKGLDDKRVGTLYIYVENRMSEVLDAYAMQNFKIGIGYLLILMVIFTLLITKFISLPLRDIMHSLETKSKIPLKKYLLKENEYGAIATALCESFENKEALENLNRTLEQRVKDEVESGRLKDRVLFQQAKLAALGEMLTNIAHQWRQPLNTISVIISKLYLQNKSEKLTSSVLEEEIQKLRSLIQDMSATIDDFKDFFQTDKTKSEFYLYQCIEESLRISDGGLSKGHIDVRVECSPSIVFNGYRKELSHVLLVLINNSKDALIERNVEHGVIHIRGFEQEHYVIIEVCDNAGGVLPGHLPRLFDPFFTTKEPEKGNGVGLYMSKQIIEQSMRGSMNATNEKEGLCVTLVLPKNDI